MLTHSIVLALNAKYNILLRTIFFPIIIHFTQLFPSIIDINLH